MCFFYFFQDLKEPTERTIEKPSVLAVGAVYELVDIYHITVQDRLSIVGGFKLNDDPVIYVWMPASLIKNYDAKKVNDVKKKLDSGKKGFAMYRGIKTTKYNSMSYDMVWVSKKNV